MHRGFGIKRLAEHIFLQKVYGMVLLVWFILETGLSKFTNVALGIAGHMGGPAKVSIVSSGYLV